MRTTDPIESSKIDSIANEKYDLLTSSSIASVYFENLMPVEFLCKVLNEKNVKKLLFTFIEDSKTNPNMAIAAANAITTLNYINFSFSGKDFKGVRIGGIYKYFDPIKKIWVWKYDYDNSVFSKKEEDLDDSIQLCKVNLNGGIFDRTNFDSADLRGVDFHGSWLNKARMKCALLNHTVFPKDNGGEFDRVNFSYASMGGALLSEHCQREWVYNFMCKKNALMKFDFSTKEFLEYVEFDQIPLNCRTYDNKTKLITNENEKLVYKINIKSVCRVRPGISWREKEQLTLTRYDLTRNHEAEIFSWSRYIADADYSPYHHQIAIILDEEHKIELWNINKNRFFCEVSLKDLHGDARKVFYMRHPDYLVTYSEKQFINVWNIRTKKVVGTISDHRMPDHVLKRCELQKSEYLKFDWSHDLRTFFCLFYGSFFVWSVKQKGENFKFQLINSSIVPPHTSKIYFSPKSENPEIESSENQVTLMSKNYDEIQNQKTQFSVHLELLKLEKAQHPEIIEYIIAKLNIKNLVKNSATEKPFQILLQFALSRNANLTAILDQLNSRLENSKNYNLNRQYATLLEQFKKSEYCSGILVFYIRNQCTESPDWKNFLLLLSHSDTSIPVLISFIDNAINEAIKVWHEAHTRDYFNLDIPNHRAHVSLPNASALDSNIAASNTFEELPPAKMYLEIPIKDLEFIIKITKCLNIEDLLINGTSSQNEGNMAWKKWFVEKYILEKTHPAFNLVVNNLNLKEFHDLTKSVLSKTNLFGTLFRSILSRDFDFSGILGEWNQVKESVDSIKKYFDQFYEIDSNNIKTLNSQALLINLIKDRQFWAFLRDEDNKNYLSRLCAGLAIPGLTFDAAEELLETFVKFHELIIKSKDHEKIYDYSSLIHILSNVKELFPLIGKLFSIGTQLSSIIQTFIDPQIKPIHFLITPIVNDVMLKAHSLCLDMESNIALCKTQILELKGNSYIDMAKLFVPYIQNQNLGVLLQTPIGTQLAQKKLDSLKFSNANNILDLEIPSSFCKLAFHGFSFKQACFRHMDFSSSFFENCHFDSAMFLEETKLESIFIDYVTAKTFLPALYESLQRDENPCYLENAKIILMGPESSEKGKEEELESIDLPDALEKYIDARNVDWVNFIKMPKKTFNPVVSPSYIPHSKDEKKIEENLQEEDKQKQENFSMLGGLTSYLPSFTSLSQFSQEAILVIAGYDDIRDKGNNEFEEAKQEAITWKEALEALKNKDKLLDQELLELKTKINFESKNTSQISEHLLREVEKLKDERELTKECLHHMSEMIGPINERWREKQHIHDQQRELLNNTEQVKIYYQTFLTQFSSALLSLFLLHNNLGLITAEKGKIMSLSAKGSGLSAALSSAEKLAGATDTAFGFIPKIANANPSAIVKAMQFLEQFNHAVASVATNVLPIAEKTLSFLKDSISIPVVGAALNIASKGLQYGIDKVEEKKLKKIDGFYSGLTPKLLEKLAEATARKLAFAFIDILNKLDSQSAKKLAHYCVMATTVALLNQNIKNRYDFPLEVLITIRTYRVSQTFLNIRIPFIHENLRTIQDRDFGITEQMACHNSGVCYEENGLTNYYSNDPKLKNGKTAKPKSIQTNAQKIGYIRVSKSDWKLLKKELPLLAAELTYDGISANNQNDYVLEPMPYPETIIESHSKKADLKKENGQLKAELARLNQALEKQNTEMRIMQAELTEQGETVKTMALILRQMFYTIPLESSLDRYGIGSQTIKDWKTIPNSFPGFFEKAEKADDPKKIASSKNLKK